jgi:hypothetical protein
MNFGTTTARIVQDDHDTLAHRCGRCNGQLSDVADSKAAEIIMVAQVLSAHPGRNDLDLDFRRIRTLMANSSSFVIEQNPVETGNPILDAVLQYWRAKREANAIPSFASLDPAKIKEYRDWLSFATALPEYADFRYSFVGQRVVQYFGSDATGLTINQAYRAAGAGSTAIESVLWIFRNACTNRAPLRVTGSGGKWHDRYFPAYDALYLPLSDQGPIANIVMCCFTTVI